MTTSRERIIAAINHQEPDRVPIDLSATPSSGISAIAYGNLVKHIGRPDLRVQIYDVVQQLAQPDMAVLHQKGQVRSISNGTEYKHTHFLVCAGA